MDSRIEDLEIRMTHQEAAIESLTASDLAQQRTIEQLRAELEYLKGLLRELTPGAVVREDQETPPPHY